MTLSDISLLFKNKIKHKGDNEFTPKSRYEESYLKKFSFRIDGIAFARLFSNQFVCYKLHAYFI